MSAEFDSAALVLELEEFERHGASEADAVAILTCMERIAVRDGGLQTLTERFSDSRVDVLARSLTFVLAQAASTSGAPGAVARLVWLAIRVLRTEDDWSRVNLLGAIQVLGARGALPSSREPVPVGLGPFLVDVLQRGDAVLDAALPALLVLDAHGLFTRFEAKWRAEVLAVLASRSPPENPFTRDDMATFMQRVSDA